MFKKLLLRGVVIAIAFSLIFSTVLAASINPDARTVVTRKLFVDFDDTNPERIVDIRWNGSENLTNSYVVEGCPDPLEFFGNSWVSQGEGTEDFVFASLVGWGSTGTWKPLSSRKVGIISRSKGCPASASVPVITGYRFFDRAPAANKFRVQRSFKFGETAYPYSFRPYIPRLYPYSAYSQVLHPNRPGTRLLVEDALACDYGCRVDNWNGTWFAMHDPETGRGLILKRLPSIYRAALWVDIDGGSETAASSVLLLRPWSGFTDTVTEQMDLCFYDRSTWTPSLTLPPGC